MLTRKHIDFPFLNHITEDSKLMVNFQTMNLLDTHDSFGDDSDDHDLVTDGTYAIDVDEIEQHLDNILQFW